MEKFALIAIDWGTSNFRAFMLDRAGNIIKSRFAKRGLLHVRDRHFYGALKEELGDHLVEGSNIPIVMSGMVGSRQGWEEAPYLNCPVALETLASNLQPIKAYPNIWIVPGIRVDYPDGRIDIMRGEEAQILGGLETGVCASQLFCLPGTHSKWAWIKEGKLDHFNTFMTGEIFNLLFKQSILGKPIKLKRIYTHMESFYKGLKWAERPEHFISQLFQVRTQMLVGKLAVANVHSFLSGLLIGHEIRSALHAIPANVLESHAVNIIANSHITQFYAKALSQYQVKVMTLNADQVTARGIFKIACQAGLIGPVPNINPLATGVV